MGCERLGECSLLGLLHEGQPVLLQVLEELIEEHLDLLQHDALGLLGLVDGIGGGLLKSLLNGLISALISQSAPVVTPPVVCCRLGQGHLSLNTAQSTGDLNL